MEVSKCWQLVEFPKISIEMKNCKTFYEGQAASRVKEIIQPLHHPSSQPDKIFYVSGTKVFLRRYKEKYKHLLSKGFKNTVLGRQEMMQCKCFSNTKQKNAGWKIWEKFLAVLREHIIFNVKWVEVQKMSEVFWAKLYCKMSQLFG